MGSITCDRVSEWKAFDDTKAGVKGLVDAGITTIPQIIIQDHHTKHKFDDKPICRDPKISIPIIDLKRIHRDSSLRSQVIDQIRSAREKWGFFQVINHGIPTSIWIMPLMGSIGFFNKMLSAPTLFWKDNLSCVVGRDFSNPEDLPEACREIMIAYNNLMWKTGDTV
ncbi:1-aminocyclopropane-1-carboxylate oxidase [Citrus sinensis]|uniref:1-aminocyclopropane-1-carboxylate oxidase n=1 Tax=Citrus sinensis TaxID=2711 RepID=A0ACB8I4L8_CITSI|nr:1-aminocyclopropane-1-carboxylate oxidase [Citrus sinensis]